MSLFKEQCERETLLIISEKSWLVSREARFYLNLHLRSLFTLERNRSLYKYEEGVTGRQISLKRKTRVKNRSSQITTRSVHEPLCFPNSSTEEREARNSIHAPVLNILPSPNETPFSRSFGSLLRDRKQNENKQKNFLEALSPDLYRKKKSTSDKEIGLFNSVSIDSSATCKTPITHE